MASDDLSTESVSFAGSAGDRLAGSLHLPAGEPVATCVFAHCFTCSKDFKAPVYIARALAERDIATLRFDFPGLGRSEGRFADTTLSGNAGDVAAAAGLLQARHEVPQIFIGHSMGGAAVLRAAAIVPEVRLCVTLAAPAQPGSTGPLFERARAEAEQRGAAEINVAGRRFQLSRGFFDDVDQASLEPLADLNKALLVVHATVDPVVPPADGARIFAAAAEPKSFLSLPGAGHLFDNPADCEYIASVIGAWTRRYLES